MDCGSGFCLHPDLAGPAANRFNACSADRGWPATSSVESKAAPTIKSSPKILKFTRMRPRRIRTGTNYGFSQVSRHRPS
jgi:hypothetical protein